MNIWQEITTTALMGTERRALTGQRPTLEASDLDAVLDAIDGTDPEGALLSAAAVTATYRRAGHRTLRTDTQLPPPAPDEVLPECSPQAALLLAMVFDGSYAPVAPEALGLLARAQQRLPPALLPQVLDFGRRQVDMRDAIAVVEVIGKRGVWLASQNAAWSYASAAEDSPDWSTASLAARVAALATLGRSDPNEARRLLQSSWAEETAEGRSALLTTRITSLSMDDEDFLESALDDRSVAVRRAAVDLLARLPESRLVHRMIERLRPLVSVKYKFVGGHSLDVELPESVDAAMVRDGVTTGGILVANVEGERASILRQMIGIVPPTHWSTAFKIAPRDMVRLAEKSDWADAILNGLAEAVGRYPASDWTLALLDWTIGRFGRHGAVAGLTGAIVALPVPELEAVLTKLLAKAPLGAPGPLQWLLTLHTRPWSTEFARAVIAKIRQTLDEFSDNQSKYAVVSMLEEVAARIPAALADEFATAWPEDTAKADRLTRAADYLIALVRFRRELAEAIG